MHERPRFTFDLEGTLVNLEGWHQLAFEKVAERLEVTFGLEQFHQFVGAGDKAISQEISRLCQQIGRRVDHEQVRKLKNAIYRDILYGSNVFPREGVPTYLEKARFVGGDLVIASLTPLSDAMHILQRSGLVPFFRYKLTEDDVRLLKPDPEVYLMSAKLLRVTPNKVLVHEDSPAGVKAAKAAGSSVAAFPVYPNLRFDPEPNAIYLSWVGLDPEEIYSRLIEQVQP